MFFENIYYLIKLLNDQSNVNQFFIQNNLIQTYK
jgi:hypothetical protein